MEQPMTKSEYHRQYYIDTKVDELLDKASRRVEILTITKAIRDIDAKLRILNACIGLVSPRVPETEK
jgi:hypothetical protein